MRSHQVGGSVIFGCIKHIHVALTFIIRAIPTKNASVYLGAAWY